MLKKYLFTALAIIALLILGLLTYNLNSQAEAPKVDADPITITNSPEETSAPSAPEAQHNEQEPQTTNTAEQPATAVAPPYTEPPAQIPVQPAPEVQYYTDDDTDDLTEDSADDGLPEANDD